MKSLNFLIIFVLLLSCADQAHENRTAIHPLDTPANRGRAHNLFVSKNGTVYLSWVESINDSLDVLRVSKLENDQWNRPKDVAHGSDWFVNWADVPSVVTTDGFMAAHWLQKRAEGTYDYDVRVAISANGGSTWSPSFIPHRDSVAAEHGFVTMVPADNNRVLAVWLDGRNNVAVDSSPDVPGGAMTLRTAEFDDQGELFNEMELDNRVCDCCQTDAVMTSAGPVVIYRDRTDEEIRDISIVRKVNGQWTDPTPVHVDGWMIAGCPVNGPAADAIDNSVVVAWFSAAEDNPEVKVAFSKDGGKSFAPPIKVDNGNPLGRVDVVLLHPDTAVVSWIEETETRGEIKMVKVNYDQKIEQNLATIETGVSRKSGFPILLKLDKNLLLAYGNDDSISTVVIGYKGE